MFTWESWDISYHETWVTDGKASRHVTLETLGPWVKYGEERKQLLTILTPSGSGPDIQWCFNATDEGEAKHKANERLTLEGFTPYKKEG